MPPRAVCADCSVAGSPNLMFFITPPPGRTEGGGRPYYLCIACWDGIVGAAMLTMLR